MILKTRKGDMIKISGDYQYRVLTEGSTIQKYWHREKKKIIKEVCKLEPTDIILDCGCGSGVIAHFLSLQSKKVVAVDGNLEAIKFARTKFQRNNLTFVHSLVENIQYPKGYFTKIFCMELLEHLHMEQGHNLLERFFMLLSKNGSLFLTTPNYLGLWPIIEWITDRTRKAPRMADDQHVSKYNRYNLTKLVRKIGFKIEICGTFSTLAPFAAQISHNFANLLSRLEIKANFPFGNIMYLQARKVS